ncbi:MAG TPA: hypothetical protein VGH46_07385 [Gaiellaceae bacterium]
MKKLLLGAALLAVTLVSASASARGASQVNLALVPLPKSALGAAGRPLPLARDSGVTSNATQASNASGDVTAKKLQHLGRVSGYMLDYGNEFGDAAGIQQIQTGIEQYRTAAEARKGLDFWRRQELDNGFVKKLGIDLTVKKLGLSGIPGPHWVYAGTFAIKSLPPVHGVDAELQDGRYLLDVTVSAGSTAAAAQLVPRVARAFRQRLQLALAGHLHGKPVALPQPLKPGPPPHGPKPAALVLKKTDLGSATIVHKGYTSTKGALDPNALSVYDLTMAPAGSLALMSQQLIVGDNALEVQYFGAIAMSGVIAEAGKAGKATPLDLSSIGDNAQGLIFQASANGRKAYEAVVVLSHGAYLEFLLAASTSALTSSSVQSVAQTAAKRLDAGFH